MIAAANARTSRAYSPQRVAAPKNYREDSSGSANLIASGICSAQLGFDRAPVMRRGISEYMSLPLDTESWYEYL